MPKFDLENLDPNDTHSVSISVYKPDGLLSFWNWFTRKNKHDDSQRKNIKFKINKEDLEKIKLGGFDINKLQQLDLGKTKNASHQCNVFTIPKNDLDPFLMKNIQAATKKTLVKRLMSKSTISVRSKESCANIKFVRTIKSHKSIINSVTSSKASFKVGVIRNTNGNLQSNNQPKNVFLKSVPTTILKSNTKKLLILGKSKTAKGAKPTRASEQENLNIPKNAKEKSNVIPMLLTRMKSMEEHLSDIGNTTKKINEAVSRKNISKHVNSQNDSLNSGRIKLKHYKNVPVHKIYSKNIHPSRKNKKHRRKKVKTRSKTKTNLLENSTKLCPKKAGFNFNYFSDSSNEVKNNVTCPSNPFNKPVGLFLNQHGFVLPNDISKLNISSENSNIIGCDLIMSMVKALSEVKGSTNLSQRDSQTPQTKFQYPNITPNVGVINEEKISMSKPIFDWRHASVSTSSEPTIPDLTKFNQEGFKVKKNISVPLDKQVMQGVPIETDSRPAYNRMFTQNLTKQSDVSSINNTNNSNLIPLHEKNIKTRQIVSGDENMDLLKTIKTEQSDVNDILNTSSTDSKNENFEIKFQKAVPNQTEPHLSNFVCNEEDLVDLGKDEGNHLLEISEIHSVHSIGGSCRILQESNNVPNAVEYAENLSCGERKFPNLIKCEEKSSEMTIDHGALCSVSIKQNAISGLVNPPEKLFKRTTISCSNAKKEPKVSITILVQDNMKEDVKMKTKLFTTSADFKEENVGQTSDEEVDSPFKGFGPDGDNAVPAEATAKLKSKSSMENLSDVDFNFANEKFKAPTPQVPTDSPSSESNNFFTEVAHELRRHNREEDLNLGSPGTYLNYEKRKILEEKVLGSKQNKCLIAENQTNKPISPTKSYSNISNTLTGTSCDHLFETSFIHQETSYSKSNFNISKENQLNPRTSLKPLENCRRNRFSEESLDSATNFDISTKYTSQKCFMYCRNNNVANFNRPTFQKFQENLLKKLDYDSKRQPFTQEVPLTTNAQDDIVAGRYERDPKKRSKNNGFIFYEDSILEESEDEHEKENIYCSEVEDSENNCIPNQSTGICQKAGLQQINDELCNNTDNVTRRLNDTDLPHPNSQNACYGIDSKQIPLINDSHHVIEDKFIVDDKLPMKALNTTVGMSSLNSICSQTLISSTSVQTDWSLLGITAEHLNFSNIPFKLNENDKNSVASQTDIMMDQIAMIGKNCENLHGNYCKSCVKNSQFSELVASNGTICERDNLSETPESLVCHEEDKRKDILKEITIAGVLLAVFKNNDKNFFEHSRAANNDLLEGEVLGCHHLAGVTEENTMNVKTDQPHRCSIPCLTTLSDETVMSCLSAASCRHLTAAKFDQPNCSNCYHHSKINGTISQYHKPSEQTKNNVTSTVESRPSSCDTNPAFCRILNDFHFGKDGCLQKENTEPKTFSDSGMGDVLNYLVADTDSIEKVNMWIYDVGKTEHNEHISNDTNFKQFVDATNNNEIVRKK